jgi:hypothetical protein
MNTRSMLLALLLLLLVLPALAAPPTYPCHRPAVAPVVDGDVAGDPAWQTIPSATGFSVLGDGYTSAKQTVARLCWTDAGLFIAVVCEEPDAKLLKPAVFDGGDTWAEDSLEIFIQPKAGNDAFQFGITAGGAKGGFEGNPDITKMKAAAQIGADSYSVEALIPWGVVNAALPRDGAQWRGNICRNIFTTKSGGDKFTSWAPLQSRFLEPDNFAFLVFRAACLTPEAAAQVTEQLNAPYRKTLLAEVAAATAQFADYREGLEAAIADEKYGEQARTLLRDWRDLERLGRQADQADILQMRAALTKLALLNRDSYNVKYGYLIRRLLQEN